MQMELLSGFSICVPATEIDRGKRVVNSIFVEMNKVRLSVGVLVLSLRTVLQRQCRSHLISRPVLPDESRVKRASRPEA